MTYEEALEFKNKLPKQITEQELLFTLYISPTNPNDFSLFTDYYKTRRVFDDNIAKLFCSDDNYSVVGLSYLRDINYLYYKHIPLTYTL